MEENTVYSNLDKMICACWIFIVRKEKFFNISCVQVSEIHINLTIIEERAIHNVKEISYIFLLSILWYRIIFYSRIACGKFKEIL